MWNPFRRRNDRNSVTLDEVKGILDAYGDLLCDEKGAIIRDESCLPTTKDRIKKALAVAIATARTNDEREGYRCAYLFLADFQPGVGPRGIMKGDLEAEDIVQGLPWLKKAQMEHQELKRELELLEQRFSRRSSG